MTQATPIFSMPDERPVDAEFTPKGQRLAGIIISAVPTLFLLLDGVMKLFKPAVVVDATVKLGIPESAIIGLGVVLLSCTVLYIIPATSVLGAILLTGYLGGAVATHMRVSAGAFPVIFPVIVGALLWLGLFLRDRRVRALIPLRRRAVASGRSAR